MKKDKWLLIGFIVFSIFIIFFGFWNIKAQIQAPFPKAHKIDNNKKIAITNEELSQILSQKDTDNDGLFDNDEIFKYSTSAYLDDSDSDGYNDKQEVEAGSDPLNAQITPLNKDQVNKKTNNNIADNNQNQEIDPEKIRTFLLKAGVSKEILDKADNETLKKILDETAKEMGIRPEEFINNNINPPDFSSFIKSYLSSLGQNKPNQEDQDINNLSVEEIKKILLTAGASEDLFKNLDDETIKKLFSEALKGISQ